MTIVNVEFGGPSPSCSAMKVRRMMSGELPQPEAAALREHLKGCDRCQKAVTEIASEKALLAANLPFEELAAGVAERIAAGARRPEVRRMRFRKLARFAVAAAVVGV